MKQINWKALIVSLAISLGAGGLAAALTSDSMEQYGNLYQPPLSPPGWLFPIVWTVLFIFMGIAACLVFTSEAAGEKRADALKLYGVQLLANVGWSVIFFRFNAYLVAFIWLLLLLPYLLWVTFAGYLNLAIALYYRG